MRVVLLRRLGPSVRAIPRLVTWPSGDGCQSTQAVPTFSSIGEQKHLNSLPCSESIWGANQDNEENRKTVGAATEPRLQSYTLSRSTSRQAQSVQRMYYFLFFAALFSAPVAFATGATFASASGLAANVLLATFSSSSSSSPPCPNSLTLV